MAGAAEASSRLLSALSLSPPRSRARSHVKSAMKSPGKAQVLDLGSPRRVHWCETVKVVRWSGNQRTTPGRIVNKM